MTEKRKYLIIGPAWIGDMVMAQSLYISLKKHYPEAKIDVVAPDWSIPLLARMPQVSNAISLPVQHGEFGMAKRFKLGRKLRKMAYSHAIVLPRSFKSALVPFFAGVKHRTGYRGEMRYGILNDICKLDKSILKQTVQRQVALANTGEQPQPPEIPFPRLRLDTDNQKKLLQDLGLKLDKPVIGFMPGAEYGPAKQWPIAKFHTLASKLLDAGYRVWIYGAEKEHGIGDSIVSGRKDIINLCGKTKLVDVVDLIACNASVVSNDSGLMHVAAAVDIPVVAIYGSSTPSYTPPLTNKKQILYMGLECSPCFKRTCKFGHTDCLNMIEAEMVYSEIQCAINGS